MGKESFKYLASGEPKLDGDWLESLFSQPLRIGVCNGYFVISKTGRQPRPFPFKSGLQISRNDITRNLVRNAKSLALLQTY